MGRLLSIEYPGGFYHVTSSSYRQEAIFEDDQDPPRIFESFRSSDRPISLTLSCVLFDESGAYSYQQIAAEFGVHLTAVGRIVRQAGKGRMQPDNELRGSDCDTLLDPLPSLCRSSA